MRRLLCRVRGYGGNGTPTRGIGASEADRHGAPRLLHAVRLRGRRPAVDVRVLQGFHERRAHRAGRRGVQQQKLLLLFACRDVRQRRHVGGVRHLHARLAPRARLDGQLQQRAVHVVRDAQHGGAASRARNARVRGDDAVGRQRHVGERAGRGAAQLEQQQVAGRLGAHLAQPVGAALLEDVRRLQVRARALLPLRRHVRQPRLRRRQQRVVHIVAVAVVDCGPVHAAAACCAVRQPQTSVAFFRRRAVSCCGARVELQRVTGRDSEEHGATGARIPTRKHRVRRRATDVQPLRLCGAGDLEAGRHRD
mmetsp:Transcript_12019/g.30389  ORF Transcript_12019/g.30389 Transcript_12019/m.30389 type:complete len:308 (+) Transcript_12019:95-1018(+)